MKKLLLFVFLTTGLPALLAAQNITEAGLCTKLATLTSDIEACWKSTDNPPSVQKNCNVFVGRAVKEIYGYDDFWNAKTNHYYSANDSFLELIKSWNLIGNCSDQKNLDDAQLYANNGKCVVAIWHNPKVQKDPKEHGHIALIVKGKTTLSGIWKLRVPNAASMCDPPCKQFVCDMLSYAFGDDKKDQTLLYYK